MRVSWRAGTLFGIFRCLDLRYRRTRDAYFHLVGDFQNYRVAVDSIDGSVDACGGDDLIAVLDGRQHFRHFLTLPLLRHDHQEIHDPEHEYQRYQEPAKPGAPGLQKKECCQIHVRYLLPYPFGATTSLTENKKSRHISGPREKNPRAGISSRLHCPPDSRSETRPTAGCHGSANDLLPPGTARFRPAPPHSARAALSRISRDVQS